MFHLQPVKFVSRATNVQVPVCAPESTMKMSAHVTKATTITIIQMSVKVSDHLYFILAP